MRWFYFILYLLFGIPFLYSQHCGYQDLIREAENWSGDTSAFDFHPERIALNASSAGSAVLTHHPKIKMTAFFIRFSLDFPPSLTNQFQLDLVCSGESGEKRRVSLIVGETGNTDGVLVQIRENNRLVNEQKYWSGKYGEGADRSEWVLSLEDGFLFLSDPVSDQTEKINLGFENEFRIYFEKIEIQCQYTQTRRNRFYFHQMQMWRDDFSGGEEINAGDIFITEIMTGSSSIIPFVEIYNAFSAEACVPGLVLKINGEYIDLPVLEFTPFSYVVLTPQQIEGFLEIPSLISFLRMSDDALISLELLLHGKMIHKAEIFVAADESDFSYEMIDILQPCRTDNWTLSAHSGGSPGEENSVFGTLEKPVLHLKWNIPGEAEIWFPYLNPDSAQLLSLIETSEGISATIDADRTDKILLFVDEILTGENLNIDIQGRVSHCGGMSDLWDTTLSVSVPELPKQYEILITEVMYDPPAGCPEYLEISNMSGSAIWMGDLFLQKEEGNPISITLPWQLSDRNVWVVTGDRRSFLNCFPETNPEQVAEEKLFILPNNGSMIRLIDRAGDVTLDEVHYESSWHHSGLMNQKGISLERNYLYPQEGGWRSGYPQFQYRSPGFLPVWEKEINEEEQKEAIVFSATGIRPGAGFGEEQLEILWNGEGGSRHGFLSIEIYDTGGNKIDQLTNSLPVQGGETIFWAGEKSSGELLKEGLYLFWVYYFDNIGTKKIFKRTCVLSRQ